MQKKKQNKPIKQIIAFIAIIIVLLLIAFAEDIIKLNNKNKTNLAENSENELISNEPNPPQLSAGMIPVKWDGANWIITKANDKEWYDYSKGKPAYIMLNDGYYQSELLRDMTNKELAENAVGNDAINVPNVPNNNPTIFMWIPRFVYKNNGEGKIEIGYIKEETALGENWILPDLFMYKISDNTKADFSLSGVWVEKDVDTEYTTKMTQMNKEESIYGFIANTKARQINANDTTELQKYINTFTANTVGNDALVVPIINNITNLNRIILQIINTNKYEPIKANITQNTVEQRLEIRVTYTSNGIKEILDEYGNQMTLTEKDGIIYTDTGSLELAKGTYKFTVVDNKGNKKELRITPTINSLFKVAYINGIDNMDNTNTYTKTQETKTAAENTLINQLSATDSSKTYSRAIRDGNQLVTAIGEVTRTSVDEQIYLWNMYRVNSEMKYVWNLESAISEKYDAAKGLYDGYYYYRNMEKSSSGDKVTLSNSTSTTKTYKSITGYTFSSTFSKSKLTSPASTTSSYYHWKSASSQSDGTYISYGTYYYRTTVTEYSRGDFYNYISAEENEYENNKKNGSYWYVRGNILPKYTIYKYDQSLNLKSTYDVDTKILTTESIDISNKGNNKVKLTLNTTGTNYKTYISNDNANWQEVTDITSNTPKELNVDGWDNLYIKIETNTSRINNIDVAFYKD